MLQLTVTPENVLHKISVYLTICPYGRMPVFTFCIIKKLCIELNHFFLFSCMLLSIARRSYLNFEIFRLKKALQERFLCHFQYSIVEKCMKIHIELMEIIRIFLAAVSRSHVHLGTIYRIGRFLYVKLLFFKHFYIFVLSKFSLEQKL